MPVYKVTMIFNQDGYGWTESYALNFPAGIGVKQVLGLYAVPLCNWRRQILVQAATLEYVRVGTFGTRFAVQTQRVNLIGNYKGSASNPALVNGLHPNWCLLLRNYQAVPGAGKSTFLRGLPDEINVNGIYTPTAAWIAALANYTSSLTGAQQAQWGWWGALTNANAPLTTYTQTQQETVLLTCGNNPVTNAALFLAIPVGTKLLLRVSGVNGKSAINGTNVYFVRSANTAETKDQIAVAPYIYGGNVELPAFGFASISTVADERLQSRKCGRQLFLEHGRAPVRKRA